MWRSIPLRQVDGLIVVLCGTGYLGTDTIAFCLSEGEYIGFMTAPWREKAWTLLKLWWPERLLLGTAFLALIIAVPLTALALVVSQRPKQLA